MFRAPIRQLYQRIQLKSSILGTKTDVNYRLFHSSSSLLQSYGERGGGGRSFARGSDSYGGRGGGSYGGRGGDSYGGRGGDSYGGRGGDSSGGRGRGGRGIARPYVLDMNKISFAKTVKIDPTHELPLDKIPLSSGTLNALKAKGFEKFTPVQSQSYQMVFNGEDVVARSRTGTGKTLAFGIPIVEQIVKKGLHRRNNRESSPLVLIIEPTRELAQQVADELSTICKPHGLSVHSVFGGSSFGRQEELLRRGVDIVVATPGRLIDHITQKTINLGTVVNVVLDEGDLMLEMGFQDDVETILKSVKEDNSKKVQMMLFSATMPSWICNLTDRLMVSPTFLDAVQEGETRLAQTITHHSVLLPDGLDRFQAVISYLEDIILTKGHAGQSIIFTNTKAEANQLLTANCFGHLTVQVLHGDINQSTRQQTLRALREKKIDVLVATDVAARGLDISGVDLVVHIAPPRDADSYVHRSGRTGRAGRSGAAVIFHTKSEQYLLDMLQKQLQFKFIRIGPPTVDEICQASVNIVTKRLERIESETVGYFIPHARTLLHQSVVERKLLNKNKNEDNEAQGQKAEELSEVDAQEALEDLFARCLAAISKRDTITSRSLLTGKEGYVTLKFTGKLGGRLDVLQRINDYLGKELKIQRFADRNTGLLKPIFARNENEDGESEDIYVADFQQDLGKLILTKANELNNKTAIKAVALDALPDYVEFPSNDRDFGRDRDGDGRRAWGSRDNHRGGAGGWSRDGGFSRDNRGSSNDRGRGWSRDGGFSRDVSVHRGGWSREGSSSRDAAGNRMYAKGRGSELNDLIM